MAVETFFITLDHSVMLTETVMQLYFNTDHTPLKSFTPGQFVTLMLKTPEGDTKRRSYSIATIPGESSFIEIAIRYLKGGIASETLLNLKPGEQLSVMGPVGRLVMQEDPDIKRYILVGTGTGIAPYRAMIPALLKRLQDRPDFHVHILEGVQYRSDVLYADDFLKAAEHPRFHFSAHLSRDTLENPKHWEKKGYAQCSLFMWEPLYD
jgi:ferredoxin-NADP reductase